MTALLSIVHQPNAGPGVFADGVGDVVEWVPSAGPPPTLDGLSAAMVFGGAMHVDQHSTHPWLRGEKQLIRELLDLIQFRLRVWDGPGSLQRRYPFERAAVDLVDPRQNRRDLQSGVIGESAVQSQVAFIDEAEPEAE